MSPIDATTTSQHEVVQGPITRARAQQLNYQVNSFLGVNVLLIENMLLPKTCDLILLRNLGEEKPSIHGKGPNHFTTSAATNSTPLGRSP